MAQQITASIYGSNNNAWVGSNGTLKSFPTQGISIQALPSGQTYAGVTCLSVIQVLPTGLTNPPGNTFYTSTALATLVTASNA